jgi:hypothetical protein
MHDQRLFIYAAEAEINNSNLGRALSHYNSYLERAPADTNVRRKRDRLRAYIQEHEK